MEKNAAEEASSFFAQAGRVRASDFKDSFLSELQKNRTSTTRKLEDKRAYVHAAVSELAYQILNHLLPKPEGSHDQWKERIGRTLEAAVANVRQYRQAFFQEIRTQPLPELTAPSWDAPALLGRILAFIEGGRIGSRSILEAGEAVKTLQPFLLYYVIGADERAIRFAPPLPSDADYLNAQAQVWRRNLMWREKREQTYDVFDKNVALALAEVTAEQVARTAQRPPAPLVVGIAERGGAKGSGPGPSLYIAQDSECHVLHYGGSERATEEEEERVSAGLTLERAIEWRCRVDTAGLLAFRDQRRAAMNDVSFPIVQVHRLASPDLSGSSTADMAIMRFVASWTPLFLAVRMLAATMAAAVEKKDFFIPNYVAGERLFANKDQWKKAVEHGLVALFTTLMNQFAVSLYEDLRA